MYTKIHVDSTVWQKRFSIRLEESNILFGGLTMLRNLFVSSVIFFVFLNIGCYEAPEKARSASFQTIGNVKLYTFASNDQYFYNFS